MKKIILIIAALILISASAYVGWRLHIRGTDINGITTMPKRNTVYINAYPNKDFTAGEGYLTVSNGKHIHVKYAFESGSFDLVFRLYSEGVENASIGTTELDNLPVSGDVFGKLGISGKGTLDFEAAPGNYSIYYEPHNAVGRATITEEK